MSMREKIARGLYEREKQRAENATQVISAAAGKPVSGMAMEPWEECADMYRGDADAILNILNEYGEEEIEIAARAAYLDHKSRNKGWLVLPLWDRLNWRNSARAAIKAFLGTLS